MPRGVLLLIVAAISATLTGCGDDGGTPAPAPPPAPPSSTAAGTIDFAIVERLTPQFLGKDPECPNGEFVEATDTLTTLTEEQIAQAKKPFRSYSCGGLVDQVVFVEFNDPAAASATLDPANNLNAVSLVEGSTAVLVNLRNEGPVDVVGYFNAIKSECGCGQTRYTG